MVSMNSQRVMYHLCCVFLHLLFLGSDGLKISITKRVKNKGIFTIHFCISTDLEQFGLFSTNCFANKFQPPVSELLALLLPSSQMWWCWKPFSVVWVDWTESNQGSPLFLSSSPAGPRPSPPSSSSGCRPPSTATSVHSALTLRTSLF